MKPAFKAIAFDLDGTLYPNYRLNFKLIPFFLKNWRFLLAFGKTRGILHKRYQVQSAESAAVSQMVPGTFYNEQAVLMSKFYNAEPGLIKNKIETLIYRGWEPHFKKIKLYPHVPETLRAFRSAGLKLALLSDFPPEKKLENLDLGDLWDAVLCSERIGRLKPDTLPFVETARALELTPKKILYVGNSFAYDIQGAKKAGMAAALISRSQNPSFGNFKYFPDFVFFDYRNLYNFVINYY